VDKSAGMEDFLSCWASEDRTESMEGASDNGAGNVTIENLQS
jgi:hypothetical protein